MPGGSHWEAEGTDSAIGIDHQTIRAGKGLQNLGSDGLGLWRVDLEERVAADSKRESAKPVLQPVPPSQHL